MPITNVLTVEPVAMQEIFVDGIASVDHAGDVVKVAYYTLQRTVDGDLERVICCRLTFSESAAMRLSKRWRTELAHLIEGAPALS